ncbi:MAG: hypothetical protein JWM86_1438 [Thermoleophilia bacterium]|nr:hypothetical protein [Thermoleophilia bacterium]
MSVGATALLSRALAAHNTSARARVDDPTPIGGLEAVAPADGDAEPNALPQTLTDAQGRVFKLQQDPVSGHPQYRHSAEQRDQAGSTLSLEILIDLSPDGSFSRRTTQQLNLANGDSQREVVLASHDAQGVQVGETVESASKEGTATTSEKTVGTYAAGKLVRRETDVEQADQATDPKTRETTRIANKIHGTWDEGGREITNATVPKVDRNEEQRIDSPGQGINKDTDRSIVFTRHGAGAVNAIDWDDAGKLVVRFEGHKGQYIEREMKVPLDQTTGAPDMANAETVRTDDKQNLVNKGLMQARIWGGLASNLSWIAGVNFAKGSLGKGFLALSAASAGAQLLGETHAVATKRNDGDWSRVAVSAYDMLLTGMLAAYMSGRKDVGTLSMGQRTGLTALGGAGLMANGSNLLGANPLGTGSLMKGVNADTGIGAQLAALQGSSPLDSQWRMEPRFDAGRALTG